MMGVRVPPNGPLRSMIEQVFGPLTRKRRRGPKPDPRKAAAADEAAQAIRAGEDPRLAILNALGRYGISADAFEGIRSHLRRRGVRC